VTASIDPVQGGILSLADGVLSLKVPVDASSDVLNLSLAEVSPGNENRRIGSHLYLLTAQDSAGTSLTSFGQALLLTFAPSATDLAAANGDLSAFAVWFLNPDTGEFDLLPSTISSDGVSMTVDLDRIGVAAASADSTAPADAPEAIDALEAVEAPDSNTPVDAPEAVDALDNTAPVDVSETIDSLDQSDFAVTEGE
jgi:hypothetical protein